MSGKPQFSCKRCLYTTVYKGCLRRHLVSGKCVPSQFGSNVSFKKLLADFDKEQQVVIYECDKCAAEFISRRTMYRHRKTCDAMSPKEIKEQMVEMRKQIADLKKDSTALVAKSGAPVHVHQHVHQHQHLHIEFNDLVKLLNCEPKAIESFSKHLTDDELTVMVAAADKAPKEVLKQLFKKTFFNTDHPENVTFTVLDPELTKGYVFGGNEWHSSDLAEDVKTMLLTMNQAVSERNQKLPEGCKVHSNNLNPMWSAGEHKDMHREVCQIAYEHRDLVASVHGQLPDT